MASVTAVNVLAPNGRRQVVKVSPNTTMLQILEEVCKKQGFKAEEYELRHQNRPLDLAAVIRFSGLANRAGLEVAAAAVSRTESLVSLVLQLVDGERRAGDFLPNASLWSVLETLAPVETQDGALALVYLRREVAGRDALEATALRDLGLTGGRALLRLVSAATDGPRQQPNVSSALPQPAPKTVNTSAVKTSTVNPATVNPSTNAIQPRIPASQPMQADEAGSAATAAAAAAAAAKANQQRERALAQEQALAQAALEQGRQLALAVQQQQREMAAQDELRRQQLVTEIRQLEQQIVRVGERDAVVFLPSDARLDVDFDLPDEFFETTVDDARVLYRDLKAAAAASEAPLLTSSQRAASLPPPATAVLRVRFPDGTVVQAVFSSAETISSVEECLRPLLRDPNAPFVLFTTPPRRELPASALLGDAGLTRCCVLHFAPAAGSAPFLRDDVLAQATPPAAAALLAARARGIPPAFPSPSPGATGGEARSLSPAPRPRPSAPAPAPAPAGRVPKWFKPA